MRAVTAHEHRDSSPARAWIQSLSEAWERQWPGVAPIAHRIVAPGRWVRFHSLPGSKRYADEEAEYQEILHRHRTVLGQLAGDATDGGRSLVVVTCSWSESPDPVAREPEVERWCAGAHHWQSVLTDRSVPGDEVWTHLFVE